MACRWSRVVHPNAFGDACHRFRVHLREIFLARLFGSAFGRAFRSALWSALGGGINEP
jgi:hypothetical protein